MKASLTIPTDEFLKMMDRALNTLEPERWPEWACALVGGADKSGKVSEGIRASDGLEIVINRAA